MRHQELLKKQKQLQEQYARLQQISKNSSLPTPGDIMQLKKTGSESNLPQKMGLNMSVSGSMKNLNIDGDGKFNEKNHHDASGGGGGGVHHGGVGGNNSTIVVSTTKQVYETDIL